MSRDSRLVEFLYMFYEKRHNAHVYEYSKFFTQVLPNPAGIVRTEGVA